MIMIMISSSEHRRFLNQKQGIPALCNKLLSCSMRSWPIGYCVVSYYVGYLVRNKEPMRFSLRNLQVRMSGGKTDHLTVLWFKRRLNPGSKPAACLDKGVFFSVASFQHYIFHSLIFTNMAKVLLLRNVPDDQIKPSRTFYAGLFLC